MTRADFYVGRGPKAEWLGSIAADGYPQGIPKELLASSDERQFRSEVRKFMAGRGDSTRPKDGWPWPWEDSKTTDYAYAFENGKVAISNFGRWNDKKAIGFPNMKAVQKVTFGPRSGVTVLRIGPKLPGLPAK